MRVSVSPTKASNALLRYNCVMLKTNLYAASQYYCHDTMLNACQAPGTRVPRTWCFREYECARRQYSSTVVDTIPFPGYSSTVLGQQMRSYHALLQELDHARC